MRSRRPRHDRGHDPRPAEPVLPWETPGAVADAELGARLERALREGPGSGHVDVAQLLRGTRRATTKRARARRTAMIAAAAIAVGAVPVGLQTARWLSPPPVVPASGGLATGSSPSVPPSHRPTPSVEPPRTSPTSRAGAVLGNDPNAVLYEIPDSVAFGKEDLPASMSETLDLGHYRWIPTVQGQQCSDTRFERLEQPVAGRAWTWVDDAGRPGELLVDLNVTGWASDKSALAQLTLVRRDTGACRFAERISPMAAGNGSWVATGLRSDGTPRAFAATVVAGGLIVGVTVTDSASSQEAVKYATTLVQAAVRNLEKSGLTKQLLDRRAAGVQLSDPGAAPPAASTSSPEGTRVPEANPTSPADS